MQGVVFSVDGSGFLDQGSGFVWPQIMGCYVTEPAPHQAINLIACSKLTFNAGVVVHRVGRRHLLKKIFILIFTFYVFIDRKIDRKIYR